MEIGGFCGSLSFHLTPDFPLSSDRDREGVTKRPLLFFHDNCGWGIALLLIPQTISSVDPTLLSVSAFDHLSALRSSKTVQRSPLLCA